MVPCARFTHWTEEDFLQPQIQSSSIPIKYARQAHTLLDTGQTLQEPTVCLLICSVHMKKWRLSSLPSWVHTTLETPIELSYMMAIPSWSSKSGTRSSYDPAIAPVGLQFPAIFLHVVPLNFSQQVWSSIGPLPTDQQLHAWGSGKLPDHQSMSSFLINGRPPVLSAQLKLQSTQFSKTDTQPHFRYYCLYFETGLYYFIWATTRSTIALQCSCGNIFRVWGMEPISRIRYLIC